MTDAVEVPDAIVAAVRAAAPNWTVYDGLVKELPDMEYAVVYPDDGQIDRLSMRWQPNDGTWRWFVTSVAPTRHGASWHARTVREYLMNVRIVADGWRCSKIRHEHSANAARDEPVTSRPSVTAVNEYSLLATRI